MYLHNFDRPSICVCIEPGWWCGAKFGRPRAPDEQKRERLRQKGGFAKAPGYSWPCSTRVTYVQAPASSETLSCNVSSMVKKDKKKPTNLKCNGYMLRLQVFLLENFMVQVFLSQEITNAGLGNPPKKW